MTKRAKKDHKLSLEMIKWWGSTEFLLKVKFDAISSLVMNCKVEFKTNRIYLKIKPAMAFTNYLELMCDDSETFQRFETDVLQNLKSYKQTEFKWLNPVKKYSLFKSFFEQRS